MANDQKINGSFEGNKLNISITTSSNSTASSSPQQNSTNPIQPIESTGKKVASIAEQTSKQQNGKLNRRAVKQDKEASSNVQEIQVLKEINQKLSALNDAVLSIEHKENNVTSKETLNNMAPKRLDQEIFTPNFSESLKNSSKALLDDSSF